MSDALLAHFLEHRDTLASVGSGLHERLERLVRASNVPLSFVSWRVKEPRSLAIKLARPDRSYRQLWDVTDLVALRVATSFEDHVEQVARLIEQHFQVDFSHSLERQRPQGYRSVHYVCALDGGPHPDFRFEVQVRTALQHAWAEVEHDLGYKSDDPVPEPIRRRFARVASLLELADEEFVSIRRELLASRDSALATLERDGDLPLDLVSLEALLRRSEVDALDRQLAQALDKPLAERPFFPDYLVQVLRLSGLGSTAAVQRALQRHAADVRAALPRYFDFSRRELGFSETQLAAVERGYGLFFVAHLHVVRGPELVVSKVGRLTRLYQALEFPNDERAAHRVASAAVNALSA